MVLLCLRCAAKSTISTRWLSFPVRHFRFLKSTVFHLKSVVFSGNLWKSLDLIFRKLCFGLIIKTGLSFKDSKDQLAYDTAWMNLVPLQMTLWRHVDAENMTVPDTVSNVNIVHYLNRNFRNQMNSSSTYNWQWYQLFVVVYLWYLPLCLLRW